MRGLRATRPAATALVVAAAALVLTAGPSVAQEGGGDTPDTETPQTTGTPETTDAPPPTDAPPTSDVSPTSETPPDTGSSGRLEGEGADIVVVLLVGIGGLLVVGFAVAAIRGSRQRRDAWRTRALGAYREGVWVHDTLVPGRLGSGLEARSVLSDVRRRAADLSATLAGLEVQAPDDHARAALDSVRTSIDALVVAFESDLAVRTGVSGATRDQDLQLAATTAAQRRSELGSALEALRATF